MFGIDGGRRACCRSREWNVSFPKVYTEKEYQDLPETKELKSVMASGQWHSICERCKIEEERGAESMRQKSLRRYSGAKGRIEFLEFTLSNKCNLACRMCNHKLSTTWGDYARQNPGLWKDEVTPFFEHNLDQIKKWLEGSDLNYLRRVKVAGGEPFMSKRFFEFIDWLIDEGYSKNISLQFITNGTFYSDKIIEKFKRFGELDVQMSIEGTGKLEEYIRQGTDWEIKRRNIDKWLDSGLKVISASHCLLAYNYHDQANFEKWCENTGFERVWLIYVEFPTWLSYNALPSEYIKTIEPITDLGIKVLNRSIQKHSFDEKRFNELKRFTRMMDKMFNKNLMDINPNLGVYIY